jgi:hypothetical protein
VTGGGASPVVPALVIAGAPRSGTSLVYKALCLHPEAAWISNWQRRAPGLPAVARINRLARRTPDRRRSAWFSGGGNAYVYGRPRSVRDRTFPMPVEGTPVFERHGAEWQRFAAGGRRLAGDLDRIRRAAGGSVLVSKRVRNNHHLPALLDALGDARVVHVVRDGRAVCRSLREVDWWPHEPLSWYAGTPTEWAAEGGDPWEACARTWVSEVDAVGAGLAGLPPHQVLEVRYEHLVTDPIDTLEAMARFGGLPADDGWSAELGGLSYPDRRSGWRRLEPDARATIERIAGRRLADLGYLEMAP